jgi:ectoine hydroxylase-related dioxygenase (phytanoyl-CoA dioxygenase family)
VIVPKVFSADRVAAIKAVCISELKAIDRLTTPSGVNVWMADEMPDALKAVVIDPALSAVVCDLIGDPSEFLSVKTVFKSREKRFASPWHQDWFYWKGAAKLSAWVALDPATVENGCLRIIPGTHDREFPMVTIEEGPGFAKQIDPAELEGLNPVDVEVEAGDVVFFHDLAVHASHKNTSGSDRWSLIATYRHAARPDESTVWTRSLPLT